MNEELEESKNRSQNQYQKHPVLPERGSDLSGDIGDFVEVDLLQINGESLLFESFVFASEFR
jgi:hypothetical protein